MSKDQQQQQQITGHRLEVTVEEARDLKATNYFSSTESDAFCELNVLDGVVKKTEVVFKTLCPKWEEKFTFELSAIPEGEVLFLTVWGRHMIGKNTFVGRVEVPLTMLIEPLVLERLDLGSYSETQAVSRWFKLLPVYGSTAWDQAPGFVRLTLQYKYVPEVVPTRVVPAPVSATTPASLATMLPPPPAPTTQQPPNTTLCYQCPLCSQLFMPDVIMAHMQECVSSASSKQQQPQQQPQQAATTMQAPPPPPSTTAPVQQQQQQQQVMYGVPSSSHLPSAPQYHHQQHTTYAAPSQPPMGQQQQQQQQPPQQPQAAVPTQQTFGSSIGGVAVYPPGVMPTSAAPPPPPQSYYSQQPPQQQQQQPPQQQQQQLSTSPTSYNPAAVQVPFTTAAGGYGGQAQAAPSHDAMQYYSYAATMVGGPTGAQ